MRTLNLLKLGTAVFIVAVAMDGASNVANATLADTGTVAVGSGGAVAPAGDTLASAFTLDPIAQVFGLGTPNFNTFTGTTITDPPGFTLLGGGAVSSSYSFTSAMGTFTATSEFTIAPATAHALNIDLVGTWSPTAASGLTLGPTPAELIANFTQVGGAGTAISYGGTLTTTFSPIPEPISLSVLGMGLIGLGIVRRRKKV
jgi:hypothetical protein